MSQATGSWQEWLAQVRYQSPLRATQVPLCEAAPVWDMRDGGFRFGRDPEGFFNIIGVEATSGTSSWKQPMLQEVGSGFCILLKDHDGRYLISAKAQPGNVCFASFERQTMPQRWTSIWPCFF